MEPTATFDDDWAAVPHQRIYDDVHPGQSRGFADNHSGWSRLATYAGHGCDHP